MKLIHEVRAVKTKKEIANIIKAQRISERVLADTLMKLRTGVSELEIANFIKNSFIRHKAPVLSFSPIVSFGKNTANIHHEPGRSKLKAGDIIMFDFGTTINHYCSDMSRTYFWGRPTEKQKKVYLAVLAAQNRAINKIMKGERRAKIIDKSAREFLGKKFKNNFKHGLGHGVGTVIHEWPNLKPKSEDVLPAGCVMTVEPGIYLPNFGGVRIEDIVLITKRGCQNLTNVPKDIKNAILDPWQKIS
jgi:Xaa-Pro aminopeptidase